MLFNLFSSISIQNMRMDVVDPEMYPGTRVIINYVNIIQISDILLFFFWGILRLPFWIGIFNTFTYSNTTSDRNSHPLVVGRGNYYNRWGSSFFEIHRNRAHWDLVLHHFATFLIMTFHVCKHLFHTNILYTTFWVGLNDDFVPV